MLLHKWSWRRSFLNEVVEIDDRTMIERNGNENGEEENENEIENAFREIRLVINDFMFFISILCEHWTFYSGRSKRKRLQIVYFISMIMLSSTSTEWNSQFIDFQLNNFWFVSVRRCDVQLCSKYSLTVAFKWEIIGHQIETQTGNTSLTNISLSKLNYVLDFSYLQLFCPSFFSDDTYIRSESSEPKARSCVIKNKVNKTRDEKKWKTYCCGKVKHDWISEITRTITNNNKQYNSKRITNNRKTGHN